MPGESFIRRILCALSLSSVLVATFITLPGCSGPAAASRREILARPDFREIIAKTTNKVFPAVVYIKALRESTEQGEKRRSEVGGSGVIISPEGEILTNWHVVEKAVRVRCLLFDGRAIEAQLLGTDKDTDLALLKLKLSEGQRVPSAALGDSGGLCQGDFVMALGAPWGLSRSVSIGIIACTQRYLEGASQYSLWLQTDASISPGNSGGPLVNTRGEIVGITTLGALYGGDLAFAIPSDTIKILVPQLRKHAKVNWSWSGLRLQPLRDFEHDAYFEATDGVIVAGTEPQSPAKRAGLLPRDRILKINSDPVTITTWEEMPALRCKLGLLPKGRDAFFEIARNDKSLTITLKPRAKGKVEGEELECKRWDLSVKTINQFDNPELYFQRKKGVFIYGIKYPGNASASGLQRQDIALKINGKKVETLDDVKIIHKQTLENIDNKSKVNFTVLRDGLLRHIILDISRDFEEE